MSDRYELRKLPLDPFRPVAQCCLECGSYVWDKGLHDVFHDGLPLPPGGIGEAFLGVLQQGVQGK